MPALDRTRHGSGDPLPFRRRRVSATRTLDPAAERDRVRGHPRDELREKAGRGRRRGHWTTFALRAPVFALGTARRAYWTTFALRAPVFALGTARRAHAAEGSVAWSERPGGRTGIIAVHRADNNVISYWVTIQ
jgi:hypothetical protein